MKKISLLVVGAVLFFYTAISQTNTGGAARIIQKADNVVNKGKTVLTVFQPYLLKARELYGQVKQLVKETKDASKAVLAKNTTTEGSAASVNDNGNTAGNTGTNSPPASYPPPAENSTVNGNAAAPPATDLTTQYGMYNNYTADQYLPINNEAAINSDGSGNWGNQNNGQYGNCLDVLTGTVVSMGEAEDNPGSIDLLFFAPADGQNTYVLMTPSFARNNSTATYMTQHASDGVMKWKDVTESEVALTKLTIAQFEKIQNNSQISGAVKNAVNYSGWYTSVGTKLEGQVFAVKVEQESRTVYALVAVIKHFGTSGSNGYLKIKVKSQGIDNNADGIIDPNSYIR